MAKAEELKPQVVVAQVGASSVPCKARAFKTGSIGYYGSGPVAVGDQVCQASVSLVVQGSKPKSK